jgi:tetratricopeptide (TPR) repeat protein
VKNEPKNGRAFLQLGKTYLLLKEYEKAITAFEKSVEITNNPYAMLKIACAYARLLDKNRALEWLDKASRNGIAASGNLSMETDLDSLREDARFKEIALAVEKEQKPCLFVPEAKNFDFWVGEWDVYNKQEQKAGISVIEKISSGCGILENWINVLGLPGKSINFYDFAAKKWFQYWIGSDGIPIRFEGNYENGAMRYLGEYTSANGEKTISRLTFFNLDVNTVRQLGEDSSDGGKTFTVSYDLKYVRRNKTSSAPK